MYTCYELKSDWLKVIQLQVIFSTIKTFSIHVLTVFWNCNIWNCDIEGGTFPISANSRVRDKMDLGLGASEVKDEKIRVMQFWIGSLKIGWFFSQWKYSSLLVFANIRVGSHIDKCDVYFCLSRSDSTFAVDVLVLQVLVELNFSFQLR